MVKVNVLNYNNYTQLETHDYIVFCEFIRILTILKSKRMFF